MKLLLDTNALIWGMQEPAKLSAAAVRAMRSNQTVVSIVSHWEIAIKQSVGKLPVSFPVDQWQEEAGLELLPVTLDHVRQVSTLPRHHRDPFDRMLIAQALVEGLAIVTRDRLFARYGVEVIPA